MSTKSKSLFIAVASLVLLIGVISSAAAQESSRPLHARRAVRGQISVIEGSSVTVLIGEREATFATNENTQFHILGQETAVLADFEVGDSIIGRGQRLDDGSLLATAVFRLPDGELEAGRIDGVGDNVLILNGRDGQQISVQVTADTLVAMRGQTFAWSGDPAGQELLRKGMRIAAFGEWIDDGTFAAHTLVSNHAPRPPHRRMVGEITRLEEDGFTITTMAGETMRVITDSNTRFRHPDLDEPTLADFSAGDRAAVAGQITDAGVLARLVAFVPADRLNGRAAIGEITAITGETIKMTTRSGHEVTLITNDETRFRVGTNGTASLADFSPGDSIAAGGLPTDMEATFIAARVIKRG